MYFKMQGFTLARGQFAIETDPRDNRFDAIHEEVLHIITLVGYANVYPIVFGECPGTVLAACLDLARGGHF